MDILGRKIIEVEAKIKETHQRFPFHSVQPYLIQEMESLEEELLILKQQLKNQHAKQS